LAELLTILYQALYVFLIRSKNSGLLPQMGRDGFLQPYFQLVVEIATSPLLANIWMVEQ
jgi:hypothetical protein